MGYDLDEIGKMNIVKWKVEIPLGSGFWVDYTKHISPWKRFWMRFIGWKVVKVEEA
tara:strand:- start:627 stop:794 length:168 start_codon:yes stop_codon:yes gene_type:complete